MDIKAVLIGTPLATSESTNPLAVISGHLNAVRSQLDAVDPSSLPSGARHLLTPLTALMGSFATLISSAGVTPVDMSAAAFQELGKRITAEVDALNDLVESEKKSPAILPGVSPEDLELVRATTSVFEAYLERCKQEKAEVATLWDEVTKPTIPVEAVPHIVEATVPTSPETYQHRHGGGNSAHGNATPTTAADLLKRLQVLKGGLVAVKK